MYPSAPPSTNLPVLHRLASIPSVPREPRRAPASYSPSRPQAPCSLHQAATAALPARSLQSPSRTNGSPSPPAFRFSVQPSIPHAALHRAHPRSSASRSQKLRDQTPPDPRRTDESPLLKHAPPIQSRSPPKTPRYTAPSASAPLPQSLHPLETSFFSCLFSQFC